VLAFLIRPIGIVLPVALFGALGSRRDSPLGLKRIIPPAAVSLIVMVALWLAMPRIFGSLSGQDLRVQGLRYWFMVTPSEYANWNANLLLIAAFPFAPLFLRLLTSRRLAIRIAVISVVMVAALLATLRSIPTPLPDWQTWSLQDVSARAMIGGTLSPSAWSIRLTPFVKSIGIVVCASMIVALVTAARSSPRAGRVLLALGALNVVLINALWFYNDRYYLILIPTLAYIAAVTPTGRTGTWVAGALLAVWAFISVTGTRDMLATNAVTARIASELEAQGVPPSDIDAGYSLNGWRLYVHPENLPPHADRRYDVPFVTSNRDTLFRIVNAPQAGYDIVRTEKLPAATWQVTDRLYVVKRQQ
jgi:hypothetical protein